MRPLKNTERVLNNVAVEKLLEKERSLGNELKFEDIIDEVAGVYPKVMMEGKVDMLISQTACFEKILNTGATAGAVDHGAGQGLFFLFCPLPFSGQKSLLYPVVKKIPGQGGINLSFLIHQGLPVGLVLLQGPGPSIFQCRLNDIGCFPVSPGKQGMES